MVSSEFDDDNSDSEDTWSNESGNEEAKGHCTFFLFTTKVAIYTSNTCYLLIAAVFSSSFYTESSKAADALVNQ